MPAGSVFALKGDVDIRAMGNHQRLQVEIEGNFADGTQFQVLANGLSIGSITGRLQHGELEIELENGATLTGGFQASAINSIEVRDLTGNSLLLGRFAALGAGATAPRAGGLTKTEVALVRISAAATSVGAVGQVELRSQGAQQEFSVRVDAAVADGTVWLVFANGIQVGTLQFRLNGAEFRIQSETPLPPGLGSLAAISSVSITDGATTLLGATLK
jgi:hypothetical protein